MSFLAGLRSLFGVPKPPKRVARPKQKTVLPPSERAALLKEALAAHRVGRAHVRDSLEKQLNELRAKVPSPARDPDSTTRLLTLHQADGALKRLMTHDLKRFLVLVGIRQMLDEPPPRDKPARPPAKR